MYTRRGLFTRLVRRDREPDEEPRSVKNDFPSPCPFPEIPELTDEWILYEAMRLGIDPSTETVENLRHALLTAMARQKPRTGTRSRKSTKKRNTGKG